MKIIFRSKTRSLIFLAVFVLSDLLVLIFVIWRTAREINSLNLAINNERVRLEASYQRRKTARLTVNNLKQIQAELPALESSLLHAGEELSLITALEDAATAHRITQKINLEPREDKKDFGDKITLTLTIDGAFQDILRYMNELERMKIIIGLDNIVFSQALREDERLQGKVRGLLRGHLYFAK